MPPQPTHARSCRLALVGLGALLVGAPGLACGSDDGYGSDAADTPAGLPASATSVDTFDFGFEPGESRVKVGDAITWTNTGDTIHTVKGKGFFSRAINPSQSYKLTFRKPGTFDYLCTLHPTQMTGTVVVER
jgi:plastocyanin